MDKNKVDDSGMRTVYPADEQEILLGLRVPENVDDMSTVNLMQMKLLIEAELKRRSPGHVTYREQLAELVEITNSIPGTSGQRALRKIIMDLEGDGPIGELLFTLDDGLTARVIKLLQEFDVTGRSDSFNTLHYEAREAIRGEN